MVLKPLYGLYQNLTTVQENTLSDVLKDLPYGNRVIFNWELDKLRIWDGSKFINSPSINIDGGVLKRQEKYSGLSNASGIYTVVFPTPFTVAPIVQPVMNNQDTTNVYMRLSDVSPTGFTINVYSINTTSILGIITLGTAVTPLANVTMDVLVTEK